MSRKDANRRAAATWVAPETSGAFMGFIGPRTLASLVQSTAPYLFDGSVAAFREPPAIAAERLHEHAAHPLGWWSILRNAERVPAVEAPSSEQLTDYFALCVAAHFASVATYVPTDVDTKIRAHLWWKRTPEELARMRAVALGAKQWDVSGISARLVLVDDLGPVSGHDGERLSILCGGLLGHLAAGEAQGAKELEEAVDAELAREATAFERLARAPGRERDLLILAASIVHNAGDVDQGLSASWGKPIVQRLNERFGRLAHDGVPPASGARRRAAGDESIGARPGSPRGEAPSDARARGTHAGAHRYGGAFSRAAALYRELMASEGHRHYPLRETKLLRAHPGLLLPVGPFLDEWGATLGGWSGWTAAQRAEVLTAIVHGVQKVKGQQGYFRALAGFAEVKRLDASDLQAHLPSAVRATLKDAELRKKVAVRRESFESAMAKRARAILASAR